MAAPTAADVSVIYGFETTYATEASTLNKAFGNEVKISPSRDNSMRDIYDLGSQDMSKQEPMQYTGTLDIDFIVTDGFWLRGLIGDPVDGGATPFTHTYTYDNVPVSMTVMDGTDLTVDSVVKYLGVQVVSGELSMRVNEPITGRLSTVYSTETEASTGFTSQIASPTAANPEEPFNFAQASLTWDGGTISNVQEVTATFSRNTELLYAIGSRFAQCPTLKERRNEFRITVPFENAADFLEELYGSATGPAATVPDVSGAVSVTITNGLAGTAERSIVINLADVKVVSHSNPAEPVERRDQDVTFVARTLTDIIYSNNTMTSP